MKKYFATSLFLFFILSPLIWAEPVDATFTFYNDTDLKLNMDSKAVLSGVQIYPSNLLELSPGRERIIALKVPVNPKANDWVGYLTFRDQAGSGKFITFKLGLNPKMYLFKVAVENQKDFIAYPSRKDFASKPQDPVPNQKITISDH